MPSVLAYGVVFRDTHAGLILGVSPRYRAVPS
jgi:hypothetical protein